MPSRREFLSLLGAGIAGVAKAAEGAEIDLVVFNAGNNQRMDFREVTAQLFEDFWRVGCFAGFLVGREAARRLAPLGRGTVIFTGASGSLRGKAGFAQFAAAKAGLRMISLCPTRRCLWRRPLTSLARRPRSA